MAAVDNLRDKWESISPRERRLVVLLGISAVVVLVLYVALAIKDRLDALEAKNAQSRKALHTLTTYKATARTASGANDPSTLITAEPVKLESYIYKAGETAKITVPGVNPRTPTTRGKFTVHAAQVEIRDLTLLQVKDFLQALESDSRVVMVTNLRLTRNFRDTEKMDLSAEISTYSKAVESATTGSGSGSGTGSGTAKTGEAEMSLSPRLRLAARIGGYVVLALVTFVIALHLTFPYERIRDRAIETLSTKYDVTIGGVERSWVPGRFSLTAVTLRSRPTVAGQSVTTMYFKRIEIDLAFLPLLGSKIEIGLDVSTGNGSIKGTITQQKVETSIDLRLARVPLTTIPGISDAVGLPMGGNADGRVKLKIAKGDWSKAAGVFELACSVGCTIGDGVTKIYPKPTKPGQEAWAKDGVAVPLVKIQRYKLAIDVAKGVAKRRTFEITSTDGEADIDFEIKLAHQVADSTITGCIKYKCSKELYERERNFRVQCDFGSPVVDDQGFHHIKLLGKLTNVRRIGALCDGQSSNDRTTDPLQPVGDRVIGDRPRLDIPVAETLHLDAAQPEVDASVAPPPVEQPVMGRPRDDVPPPPLPGGDGVPMDVGGKQVPPPTINGGSGSSWNGGSAVPSVPEGGRGQTEGVAPPQGEKPIQ